MQETIEISLDRFEELLDSERFLGTLIAAGVDNWDGYGFALEMLEERGT